MSDGDRVYPCLECGVLRSKNEGGTVFTVCDDCWDRGRVDRYALQRLASNLAIGAALCASYRLGLNFDWHKGGWYPGNGRGSP